MWIELRLKYVFKQRIWRHSQEPPSSDKSMAEALSGMGLLPDAGSCHLLEEDLNATFAWLDRVSTSGYHSMLVSRLPPRRLLGRVDLNTVETLWLTERQSANSISPSLERLASTLRERIAEKSGIIILDGLEHLISQHGFPAVLTFMRAMIDDFGSSGWRLLIPIEPMAFKGTELSRLRREAPVWEIPEPDELVVDVENQPEVEEEVVAEKPKEEFAPRPEYLTSEDGSVRLVHLTKLPRSGFSTAVLRRRILAWRRMDLDVSELEPAMKYQDMDRAYALYRVMEEKVRTAVELDRRVDFLMSRGDLTNATSFRFRIRQLTGLQEIWRSLDILLED